MNLIKKKNTDYVKSIHNIIILVNLIPWNCCLAENWFKEKICVCKKLGLIVSISCSLKLFNNLENVENNSNQFFSHHRV